MIISKRFKQESHGRVRCGKATYSGVMRLRYECWHTVGCPTHDILDYFEDKRCTLCGLMEKTQKHIFFRCRPIKALLMKIKWWLHMDSWIRRCSHNSVFKQHFRETNNLMRTGYHVMSSMIYLVWRARHHTIFEGVCRSLNIYSDLTFHRT